MVDSAAVAGCAPKAPNGSSKSSATIKDFLRLRMDFFPSGCGFLDSGSGSERRRTGGTGGRLAAHLFLALQRASSLAPPQQRLRFCPPWRTLIIPAAASAPGHFLRKSADVSARSVLPPCVDGSELARAFFTFAGLVGAPMCSAC